METAALILQGRDDYTASEPVAGALPLLRIIRTFKYAGIKRVALAGEEYIMNEAFNHATRLGAEFIHATRSKRKTASYQANAITYHISDGQVRQGARRAGVLPAVRHTYRNKDG